MPRNDDVDHVEFRGIRREHLPADLWWLTRVVGEREGQQGVPYHAWLLWHWQFFIIDPEGMIQ